MTSSLYPQPCIPYGEPGYRGNNPIMEDGYQQSLAEWVNGFPNFTPAPGFVMKWEVPGSGPNDGGLALYPAGDGAYRLASVNDMIDASHLPPRVQADLQLTKLLAPKPVLPDVSTLIASVRAKLAELEALLKEMGG